MIKKFTSCFFALIVLVFTVSCSGDSDEPVVNNQPFTLTTEAVQILNASTVMFNGKISSITNTYPGFCWSSTPNFAFNQEQALAVSQVGNDGVFSLTLTNEFLPGTTYYVKAFSQENGNLVFGNEVSFIIPLTLTTTDVTEIFTTTATLNGQIAQGDSDFGYVGFVYSQTPNPTANNSRVDTYVLGTDSFNIEISNLAPATTYYVRAMQIKNYGTSQVSYVYGEQKEFKTAGYSGPAGGLVAYDKGVVTDGWRYLEIYPTTINYDTSWAVGSAWGADSNFISGLSQQFGSGLNNTQLIANNTSQANCAAKLCFNYTRNGFSDWFLGSVDEMVKVSNSLKKGNIITLESAWTSSQVDADGAYRTWLNNGTYQNYTGYKGDYEEVYPLRRY